MHKKNEEGQRVRVMIKCVFIKSRFRREQLILHMEMPLYSTC